MLKIITSVVLSLVTIMAVTLFAVTVPAQSQKIHENAAAIASNETYIKTVDDALENLQEAFDVLDQKKTNINTIIINGVKSDVNFSFSTTILTEKEEDLNNYSKIIDFINGKYPSGQLTLRYQATGNYGAYLVVSFGFSNAGYPNAPTKMFISYFDSLNILQGVEISESNITQINQFKNKTI